MYRSEHISFVRVVGFKPATWLNDGLVPLSAVYIEAKYVFSKFTRSRSPCSYDVTAVVLFSDLVYTTTYS